MSDCQKCKKKVDDSTNHIVLCKECHDAGWKVTMDTAIKVTYYEHYICGAQDRPQFTGSEFYPIPKDFYKE